MILHNANLISRWPGTPSDGNRRSRLKRVCNARWRIFEHCSTQTTRQSPCRRNLAMSTLEAPETLEGWYVQHDVYTVHWPQWRAVAPSQRAAISAAGTAWATAQATPERGSSAFFSILGQKGDLLVAHFRPSLEALNGVELSLRQ